MQNFSSIQALLFFPSLNRCNSVCKLNIREIHLMSLFQQPQRSTFLLSQSVDIHDSYPAKIEPFSHEV